MSAINSPLLDFPIKKAKGIVFNVCGGTDLTLQEVRETWNNTCTCPVPAVLTDTPMCLKLCLPAQINNAANVIYENVAEDANIIFGAVVDERLKDQVSITVLATGFSLQPQTGDNLDDLLVSLDQQLATPPGRTSKVGCRAVGVDMSGSRR